MHGVSPWYVYKCFDHLFCKKRPAASVIDGAPACLLVVFFLRLSHFPYRKIDVRTLKAYMSIPVHFYELRNAISLISHI
jgi:hypothetical protein